MLRLFILITIVFASNYATAGQSCVIDIHGNEGPCYICFGEFCSIKDDPLHSFEEWLFENFFAMEQHSLSLLSRGQNLQSILEDRQRRRSDYLHWGTTYKSLKFVKFLLQYGVTPENSHLQSACVEGNSDIVIDGALDIARLLIEAGADVKSVQDPTDRDYYYYRSCHDL